ncbi:myosin-like coiled-coil protein-domain-containing protein [Lipomyces japonicus]|uniref:myosin-like coiled-coil protein-domain-containing protein n=1 Tax=Lipomyces japonicus TaxID=56871 RepID=UPI0034CD1575
MVNPADHQALKVELNVTSQQRARDEIENEKEIAAKEVQEANSELLDIVGQHDNHLDKISAIQQKYSELFQEMKRHEREHIKAKKRAEVLLEEKSQIRNDFQRAQSFKEKLENLCRELQKENKRLTEQSKKESEATAEIKLRLWQEFEAEFNRMTSTTQARIVANKYPTLEIDDGSLKGRLKTFFEQYAEREALFTSVLKAKDLEVQVYVARHEKQRKIADSEAAKARILLAQVSTFHQTESELRSQLNVYVEKFRQVEETLNNSNDLFLTFRKEMEQMTKKTKKLEKENKTLTKKTEVMKGNIIEMAEERTKYLKDAEINKKRMTKLESLCRALQAERVALESKISDLEGELHDSYDDEDDGDYDDEDYDEEDEEENERIDSHTGQDANGSHELVIDEDDFPFDMKSIEAALKQYAPAHANCDESCPIHNENAPGRQEWLRILDEHRRQMKMDSIDYKKQMQKTKPGLPNAEFAL